MSDHSSEDSAESGALEAEDETHESGESSQDAAEGEPYTEPSGT